MLTLKLNGKRALVCGASRGIGRAAALALASLDCEVVGLARSRPIEMKGISYLSIDLADFAGVEKAIQSEISQHGPIEILVNNTGGPASGPIINATDADFEQAFKLHLRANALLVRCLLPGMQAKQYGRIINVISTSVKSPIENLGVSNTVRLAVAGWAKTLSYEVAPFGITVNNVLPGSIETDRLVALMTEQAATKHTSIEHIHQQILQQIPAKRIGAAEEVANVIAFLASPAASYVNGANIPVDGGRTRAL